MRVQLAAIVAVLVWSSVAHAGPLVIDGMRPTYTDASAVHFWLRNAGSVRIYLDSFLADRILVERQAEDGGVTVGRSQSPSKR